MSKLSVGVPAGFAFDNLSGHENLSLTDLGSIYGETVQVLTITENDSLLIAMADIRKVVNKDVADRVKELIN